MKYTEREVYLIILGACNNFCAFASNKEHQESLTKFAKWILEDKEHPEWICKRELEYGKQIEENLEKNGTLFQITNKEDLIKYRNNEPF